MLAYVKTLPDMATVERVLEMRRYGASTTPAKFGRILDQALDATLYGSYAFNGAPQTGRYSSRGVQIHNLARDCCSTSMRRSRRCWLSATTTASPASATTRAGQPPAVAADPPRDCFT